MEACLNYLDDPMLYPAYFLYAVAAILYFGGKYNA